MWVAPIDRASSSFRSSMSTAMIRDAPASAEPAIAAMPTPPQPITATVEPRPTLPVLIAAPSPAITPQPSRPTAAAPRRRVDLGALAGGDEGLLRERADAQRRRELGAVLQRHLLRRVVGREAVPRLAAVARPAVAAHRAPVEHHEVAGLQPGDVRADRLDDTRRLVAEQEREVVVDPALAVVQVGVADAAGLHLHHRLARTGVGDVDRDHLDRRALGECDDGLDLLHAMSPVRRVRVLCASEPPKQMQPPSTRSRPHHDTPRRGTDIETGGGG